MGRYLDRIQGLSTGDSKTPLEVNLESLVENYRSTANIVRAAQRIISTTALGNNSGKKDDDDNAADPPSSSKDVIRRDTKQKLG